MLEVKIDLLPFGQDAGRATIDNLYIANLGLVGFDDKDNKICRYGAWKTDPRVKRGKKRRDPDVVVDHTRANGAIYLVHLILTAIYRNGVPKRKRKVTK